MSLCHSKKRPRISLELLEQSQSHVDTINEHDATQEKIKKLEELVHQSTFQIEVLQGKLHGQKAYTEKIKAEKDVEIKELTKINADYKARSVYHKERYDDASAVLASMKQKHTEDMESLRLKLETQRTTNTELNNKLNDLTVRSEEYRNNSELQISEYREKVKVLESKVGILTEMTENAKDRIENSSDVEVEQKEKIDELESRLSRLQELEKQAPHFEKFRDDNVKLEKRVASLETINESLQIKVNHYSKMNQNVELLRIERDSLKSKLKDLTNLKEEKSILEMENINLKAERNAWAAYLDDDKFNTRKPAMIIEQFKTEAYKAKQIDYIKSNFQNQLESQQEIISGLETHMEELKKLALEKEQLYAAGEASKAFLNDNVAMLQRRVSLLEDQLASYDMEEEVAVENYDKNKTQRIKDLEELLNQREAEIIAKNQELSELTSKQIQPVHVTNGPFEKLTSGTTIVHTLAEAIKKEQEHLKELEEKIVSESILKKQYEAASKLVEQLHKALASRSIATDGQDPIPDGSIQSEAKPESQSDESQPDEANKENNYRILQLINNPASADYAIRKSQITRLEEENQQLVKELRTHGATNIPQITLDNLYARVQELDKVIESRDKRIDRLKTVFQEKVDKMTFQIRRLLGFGITFRNDELIYLESEFATPSELYFLVKEKNDAPEQVILRIMGSKRSEYHNQWRDYYEQHIVLNDNIPAFLNAVQFELNTSHRAEENARHEVYDEEEMVLE